MYKRQVVEEETNLAHETAANILGFFENIDMEDEMDASDIRDLINDIQSFYQQCFIAGVNISSNNVDLEELKKSAPKIVQAMRILQKDYSEDEDISVLYSFSSNPIGVVLPFLKILQKVNNDIDTAYGQMHSEKENLTRKGNWNDNVDPRFEQQQKDFEILLKALEGVE